MEVIILGEFFDVSGKEYILVGVFDKDKRLITTRYIDPIKVKNEFAKETR